MFIGHFAVGFAAKKLAPETSLGTGFIACQFLDLLWPLLVFLGFETVRVAAYASVTKRTMRDARALLWTLVGFLIGVYLLNAFGPTPPPETPSAAIAGPALAMWLIVYWGYAADRAATRD